MGTYSLKLIFLITHILFSFFKFSTSIDSITQSQSLLDDDTTLISKNGTFELGFFSPGNSTNRYIGIWYKFIPIKTVFWVANRNNPINDSSGVLAMNQTGNLLLNQSNTLVWSARLLKQLRNPVLQLLDTGNLVLREENDENPDNYSWQSFDYPTDTLLPGMKLGWDLKNKIDRRVTAWKNPNDPSPGNFSWGMELHNYPETVAWMGSKKYVRFGPWNGITVSSIQPNVSLPVKINSTVNDDEVYYDYTVSDKSLTVLMVLNQSNNIRHINIWSPEKQIWRQYLTRPRDPCDNYGLCGPYGYCDVSKTPYCICLKGFKAKSPEKWNSLQPNYTDGCERVKPLSCADNEIWFRRISELKVPDTTRTWVNKSMNLEECRIKCLSNCSCSAYGNTDIRGNGSGCVNWFGDIIDLRVVLMGGQDIHLRMPASELRSDSSKEKIGMAIGCAIAGVLAILLLGFCFCRKKANIMGKEDKQGLELPLFDFSTITSATDNFSINNKLGEGGFGPVYKGKLTNGQEIAVKRLSKNSGQGINEFKNEVTLIVKLQHRNLVNLLGCCIQGEEKMLIYEYMPNKSLDTFIFEPGKQLNWSTWYGIICGVARGLVYLHQDSRLRIVHRDLKASNVLLDLDMNPKISDFGIARTFGGDETEANTKRVVGTYGYMAPEYAIAGQFSVKSDVFSFGILLLEMISGKRNRGFYRPNNHDLNLIGYAWRLWKEGRSAELIDETFGDTLRMLEVLRCIHIGLLCVQQHPEDRPTMSSVVMMLSNENSVLSQPKQPGFFIEEGFSKKDFRSSNDNLTSTNEMTITVPEAR